MKNVHIDEWLSDLVNEGYLKDKEEIMIKINGREIVVLKTVCHPDGDIDFEVVKSRC